MFGGQVLAHGATSCREGHWGWVRCKSGGRQWQQTGRADPLQCKLVLGTYNITSLEAKKLELMQEVEWYQLHINRLTSIHCSGTRNVNRAWTSFQEMKWVVDLIRRSVLYRRAL